MLASLKLFSWRKIGLLRRRRLGAGEAFGRLGWQSLFRQETLLWWRRSRYSCCYHTRCRKLWRLVWWSKCPLRRHQLVGHPPRPSPTFSSRTLRCARSRICFPRPPRENLLTKMTRETMHRLPGAWGRTSCLQVTRTKSGHRDDIFPLRYPLHSRDENLLLPPPAGVTWDPHPDGAGRTLRFRHQVRAVFVRRKVVCEELAVPSRFPWCDCWRWLYERTHLRSSCQGRVLSICRPLGDENICLVREDSHGGKYSSVACRLQTFQWLCRHNLRSRSDPLAHLQALGCSLCMFQEVSRRSSLAFQPLSSFLCIT